MLQLNVMESLLNFITGLGVLAVILVVYAESGLLIGFFLPGDSLLFTAGFLAQQGIGSFGAVNIHLFVVLLWVAAVLGDSTGYAFGHRVGRKLFERENTKFFKKKYLIEAEKFFDRHGPISIVLARFVPIVRTFTPIIAGTSKMHYKTFVLFNMIGGLLWTASFTYLGFFAGKVLHEAGINIEVAAIIIVLVSVAPMIIHTLKNPTTRDKLIHASIRQLKVIFGKIKPNKKP